MDTIWGTINRILVQYQSSYPPLSEVQSVSVRMCMLETESEGGEYRQKADGSLNDM